MHIHFGRLTALFPCVKTLAFKFGFKFPVAGSDVAFQLYSFHWFALLVPVRHKLLLPCYKIDDGHRLATGSPN